MTFAKWVSYDTVHRALFNYWEPSLFISKNGRTYTVYHSKIDDRDLNITVIETIRHRGDGIRREFYFGTFPGKHSGECATEEEAQPFYNNLKNIASRAHRVPGRELEGLILEAIEEK